MTTQQQPTRISYTYPDGRLISMVMVSIDGTPYYEISVDGTFDQRIEVAVVLKGFEAMTEEQKAGCNLKYEY